jgi:hypothetical protein
MGVVRHGVKLLMLALIFGTAQALLVALGMSPGAAKGAAFAMAFVTGPVWNSWLAVPQAAVEASVSGEEA